MSDVAVNAKRRWILIPWGAFIALILGWSVWWMIGAHQIGAQLDSQTKSWRAAGWTVSWAHRSVSGYPFRFFVQADQVQIKEPDGWGVSTPKLQAETSAITPGIIVLVADQNIVLSRPGAAPLTISGDVLRMSLGGLSKSPPRIAVEGKNLRLVPATGGAVAFSVIDRFEARLTPDAGDTARVFFRIDKATPSDGGALARIAAGKQVTVDIEGALSHASSLRGASWSGLLDHWKTSGGRLDLAQGGVLTGDDVLVQLAPSAISLDDQGYLLGALDLQAGRIGDAMQALSAIAVLPGPTAAVASGLAAGQPALPAGAVAETKLEFHEAQTWLGTSALGEAPRIAQPPAAPARRN